MTVALIDIPEYLESEFIVPWGFPGSLSEKQTDGGFFAMAQCARSFVEVQDTVVSQRDTVMIYKIHQSQAWLLSFVPEGLSEGQIRCVVDRLNEHKGRSMAVVENTVLFIPDDE
jgi:hypothetical protein